MKGLLRVAMMAAQLGTVDRGVHKLRHWAVSIAVAAVALFCVLAAVLWLDVALWFACLSWVGPTISALIAAGALVLLAVLVVAVAQLARPRRRASSPAPALAGAETVGREVNQFIRKNPQTTLLLAVLAGLALSSAPRSRR